MLNKPMLKKPSRNFTEKYMNYVIAKPNVQIVTHDTTTSLDHFASKNSWSIACKLLIPSSCIKTRWTKTTDK